MSTTKTAAQILRETTPPPPTLTQRIARRTLVVLARVDGVLAKVEQWAKEPKR